MTEGLRGNGAVFDASKRFRYELWRDLGDLERALVFIMLNPSIADEVKPDPTVRRCVGFARTLGYGGVRIVNLYALVSTNPRGLSVSDATGDPRNLETIVRVCKDAPMVLAAWGGWPKVRRDRRDVEVVRVLQREGIALRCLGKTQGGHPRHPVRLSGRAVPEPFALP